MLNRIVLALERYVCGIGPTPPSFTALPGKDSVRGPRVAQARAAVASVPGALRSSRSARSWPHHRKMIRRFKLLMTRVSSESRT
jgi:hypothetical protein